MTDSISSGVISGSQSTSVNAELRESSQYLAEIRVLDFVNALPARSWLGKHIYESVMQEVKLSSQKLILADRLWKILIKHDSVLTQLYALGKIPESYRDIIEEVTSVLQRCWLKCVSILKISATRIVNLNPAYVRTASFTTQSFMMVTINHSYQDSDLRLKWARIANLMTYACNEADKLLDCFQQPGGS